MKPIFTRPATPDDILTVAERMRQEDRDEVVAASGIDPLSALLAQYAAGMDVQAAGLAENDRVEVLYGCDPVAGFPHVGVIWLLSTDVIYDHPVEFTIHSRELFFQFHEHFPVLTNFVDTRNTRHIRWLRWLGCHMVRKVNKFGPFSLPFIEFASVRCA